MKKLGILSGLLLVSALIAFAGTATAAGLTAKQKLGMFLFMDKNLSNPPGQACMTCHHPAAGFADPANRLDPVNNVVSVGADGFSVGGRNAPSAAYAAYSPIFHWDTAAGMYLGGQFWDGRAATLKDQAKGPFLNPVEMANTKEGVVTAVARSSYAWLFVQVFGADAFKDVESAYDKIAEAIADYEGTQILNKFTSKYDAFVAGKVKLTAKEALGLTLFNGKGNCAACHPGTPGPYNAQHALFTDYSYDNLGIPKSLNPLLVNNPIDYGLGGRTDIADPNQYGKFKVATLRNIAKTPPYGHNGYFATLKEIVHFYNTAGDGTWPLPEVDQNVNRTELGNLGLTDAEENAIVAFLMTLSDGYICPIK